MMYPILVEPERVLSFEDFDRRANSEIRWRAAQGAWCSAPPIVVSPMPREYRGRYSYSLYNGNSRLSVARELGLPLFGLVVENDEEIPFEELTGIVGLKTHTLNDRLKAILSLRVQPHPGIRPTLPDNYDLSYLVQEFMKWEQGRQREYC